MCDFVLVLAHMHTQTHTDTHSNTQTQTQTHTHRHIHSEQTILMKLIQINQWKTQLSFHLHMSLSERKRQQRQRPSETKIVLSSTQTFLAIPQRCGTSKRYLLKHGLSSVGLSASGEKQLIKFANTASKMIGFPFPSVPQIMQVAHKVCVCVFVCVCVCISLITCLPAGWQTHFV